MVWLSKRQQREANAAALAEFEVFNRAFVCGHAARRALAEGFSSVFEPARALQAIRHDADAAAAATRAAAERERERGVPPELLELAALQCKDGRWPLAHARLVDILGGARGVPDPPEGIVEWKWLVALCMGFLRRFPAFHERFYSAYERGAYHVSDEAVLDAAQNALPPRDLSHVALDPRLVKSRKWKRAAELLLDRQGHTAFLRDADADAPPAEPSPGTEGAAAPAPARRLGDAEIASRLWRANALRDMGLAKLRLSERPDFRGSRDAAVLNARAPLEQSKPNYSSLADDLHLENEAAMRELEAMDTDSCDETDHGADDGGGDQDEDDDKAREGAEESAEPTTIKVIAEETHQALVHMLRGLEPGDARNKSVDGLFEHERLLRREYELLQTRHKLGPKEAAAALKDTWGPLQVVDAKGSLGSAQDEIARLKLATQALPRPKWDSSDANCKTTARRRRRVARSQTTRRRAPAASTRSGGSAAIPPEDPASTANIRANGLARSRGQQEATPSPGLVAKAQRMEEQVAHKLDVLAKRAGLWDALVEALRGDTLLSCAALSRAARTQSERNHAFDAATAQLCKIRVATCSLTEGLTAWRRARNDLRRLEALGDAGREGEREGECEEAEDEPFPFHWGGRNVLLAIPSRLDFLEGELELAAWYGAGLDLAQNPFLLAVRLGERPASPRQATRKVFIEGRPVLKVSKPLAEKREAELALLETAWLKIAHSPAWWPPCSRELWMRVRQAERVVADEVQRHARFVQAVLPVS